MTLAMWGSLIHRIVHCPLVSFALNRQWFRCIIRYFATSILKIITQCFFMFFCVYHSFFQLASFYRIELFQPCIKAFLYRHFCFQTSVFSLFRSKVTEQLFQKEKLVAVCQTNFSRNHVGDFFFLRKKRLFDFFLGISVTGHVCVNSNSTQFWGLPISRRKRYNWGKQLDIRGTSGGDEKYCADGKMGGCLGYGMMRMIDAVHRCLHK